METFEKNDLPRKKRIARNVIYKLQELQKYLSSQNIDFDLPKQIEVDHVIFPVADLENYKD